jgi:alanine racemase
MRRAEIDLDAIRHNVGILLERADGRLIELDLAADAYGHGASTVWETAVDVAGAAIRVADRDTAPSDEALLAGPSLYGLGADTAFRPAMSVASVVVNTRTIDTGEGVSYGLTYRATRRTNLALVAIGYADGLDRSAGNVARLLVGGVSRRIVGRVAMNALVVELGDAGSAAGEPVVVFGDPARGEPPVAEWSASIDRPAEEVTAVFGRHLTRTYR